MFPHCVPDPDLGSLFTGGLSTLLLLMLLGSLGDVGIGDQAAEQSRNLWTDVHLFLEVRKGEEFQCMGWISLTN